MQGYPFLIGIHPTEGYTPVVVPRLLDEMGLQRILLDALASEATPAGTVVRREIVDEATTRCILLYRVEQATGKLIGRSARSLLRDAHGRPFEAIYGILVPAALDASGIADTDLDRVIRLCQSAYACLWRSPTMLPAALSEMALFAGTGVKLPVEEHPRPYGIPVSLQGRAWHRPAAPEPSAVLSAVSNPSPSRHAHYVSSRFVVSICAASLAAATVWTLWNWRKHHARRASASQGL